mmetsp:Transcript_8396/g.12803  ORF Transcript_8396/g.12803 Transcript_8396/m.12803 type:complete len:204 (-) Transcript_8396:178-789(-)
MRVGVGVVVAHGLPALPAGVFFCSCFLALVGVGVGVSVGVLVLVGVIVTYTLPALSTGLFLLLRCMGVGIMAVAVTGGGGGSGGSHHFVRLFKGLFVVVQNSKFCHPIPLHHAQHTSDGHFPVFGRCNGCLRVQSPHNLSEKSHLFIIHGIRLIQEDDIGTLHLLHEKLSDPAGGHHGGHGGAPLATTLFLAQGEVGPLEHHV